MPCVTPLMYFLITAVKGWLEGLTAQTLLSPRAPILLPALDLWVSRLHSSFFACKRRGGSYCTLTVKAECVWTARGVWETFSFAGKQ